MTTFQRGISQTNPHDNSINEEPQENTLGWEGHVQFPNGQTLLTRLLRNWPELRSGLAFSMVFVVGALVGGSLATLLAFNRMKSGK